jgi:hypothetical protein
MKQLNGSKWLIVPLLCGRDYGRPGRPATPPQLPHARPVQGAARQPVRKFTAPSQTQDGWRLVVAHDRRHFEQARRITLSPGFRNST